MEKLNIKNFKKLKMLIKTEIFKNLISKNNTTLIFYTTSINTNEKLIIKKKINTELDIKSLKNTFARNILKNKKYKLYINQFYGNLIFISFKNKILNFENENKKDFVNLNKEILNNHKFILSGSIWNKKILTYNRTKQLLKLEENSQYLHIQLLNMLINNLKKNLNFSKFIK